MSYINLVLPYIEQNLTTQLNPEHIAGRYFVSLSQLYRDFYACTGHSVKEYIRKRRISNACEKIKCSGLALSVIAQESGYSTPQAFHKQFKNVVGMTPHEYRQSDAYWYFYPFSQDEVSISVKVSTETIPACQTTLYYDPCLIGIEDRAVASLGRVEGRIFGRNGKQKGNQFCYEVMTETPGPATTNLYATCTVNYTEEEINSGW
ncbi:MAG: AraC family transcriptional regulator, partial [Clostridia bacterium]|nr:AraC family transcriptional regulator [Clostridia bacterium]